jgi:hypothetical protein
MFIDGDVIEAHSRWTDDGSRIVTEATVRGSDGQEVVVSQLGGSVDGIGMIQMPGQEILTPGMHVAAVVHGDVDLAQREHIVLDSVRVMAYPEGFVRTGPTKAGHPLKWESGCVFVTIDAAGTTAIPGDGEFPVIDASIATWNDATVNASCSYLTVMSQGKKAMEVGNDKVNVIKFRDTTWGRPAVGNDPARTYNPQAAGITTAIYIDDAASGRDGAILDADIELNGVDFDISIAGQTSGPPGKCLAELQNTLTHELGHLHGLEHPCRVVGDPTNRVDDKGNPVPDCSTVQATPTLPANMKILEATMFNFQECGETKKETLSDDDIQSMCSIYPASAPHSCQAVGSTGGGGCCSASGRDRPELAFLLAGTTLLALRRRRKKSLDA